ncbi:MAG: stalk domain-containing protein [Senegalia sp. (in: firmicutes)]|uniref:stalk domain-containing protein n=1 Tax=Senegalia sp. (in: firmicutes) TaxID=1924098 RepID=UPI003F9D33E1
MKKKIVLILILLSVTFTFACKKDQKEVTEKNDDIDQEEVIEEEAEEEKVNPLFDTSNLVPVNSKIFLNNKPLDFSNTISQGPLSNTSGNVLVPFNKAYELLGFDVEKNESDEDLTLSAKYGKIKVYISINIDKNVKSISINNQDLSGNDISVYILENKDNDSELLIPLEFIAQSIDSNIFKGNEKNSLVLNFKEDVEEKKDQAIVKEEKEFSPVFSNIGVEIGDSLDKAKEKFGEIGDSGGYQGSDYYSFDHITIFTDIGTKNIVSIGLPDSTYSVDGIKAGDNIKKVFDKYGKKEIEEDPDEELFAVMYDDIHGYKIKYSLNDNKETIGFINIYEE